MKVKFVCLANSFKEGGKCVAGILLEESREQGIPEKPVWIRPVTRSHHGEIPALEVGEIELLDIIEVEIAEKEESLPHQTENYYYVPGSMKLKGRLTPTDLNRYLDEVHQLIFGNRGKAVSKESITRIGYSLSLIQVTDFHAYERIYSDSPFPQVRGKFNYHQVEHDFPITDPDFLWDRKRNPGKYDTPQPAYLTLSLGTEFEGWYYKLIVAVILKSPGTSG